MVGQVGQLDGANDDGHFSRPGSRRAPGRAWTSDGQPLLAQRHASSASSLWAAIRGHRALLLRAPIRRRRLIRLFGFVFCGLCCDAGETDGSPSPPVSCPAVHWGRNPARCPSLVPALGSQWAFVALPARPYRG